MRCTSRSARVTRSILSTPAAADLSAAAGVSTFSGSDDPQNWRKRSAEPHLLVVGKLPEAEQLVLVLLVLLSGKRTSCCGCRSCLRPVDPGSATLRPHDPDLRPAGVGHQDKQGNGARPARALRLSQGDTNGVTRFWKQSILPVRFQIQGDGGEVIDGDSVLLKVYLAEILQHVAPGHLPARAALLEPEQQRPA